jgi:hypothetical protein
VNAFFRIKESRKRILQFVRITLLHFILLTVFATQNDMEINSLNLGINRNFSFKNKKSKTLITCKGNNPLIHLFYSINRKYLL